MSTDLRDRIADALEYLGPDQKHAVEAVMQAIEEKR